MPTTLSAISNTNVKVRWREPYVSEGLNRKMAVVIPAGVYRGLVLGTSATALAVSVSPDPSGGDHVAVAENANGHSITYTDDTSGTLTFSLSAFATNDVVVIALFVNYTVGGTTTAEFRGYTLAEYEALPIADRNALVVLGTVTRPASGTIAASAITHTRRKLPFLQRTDESTPWNPLIRNGGFELGAANSAYRHAAPFWKTFSSSPNFAIRPVTTEARSGSKSLEIFNSSTGTATIVIFQDLWMPVVVGRYLMARLYKRVLLAATGSPTGVMRFVFGDSNGTNDVNEDISFTVSATDASFTEVMGIVKVPASARVLKSFQIVVSGTFGSVTPCIRFDDVQAWAQVDAANWMDVRDACASEVAASDLFIGPENSFNNNSAKLFLEGGLLKIDRRDENPVLLPPPISIEARTLANGIRYTPIMQSAVSGLMTYRKYVHSITGSMVEVINASYDNATQLWTKDQNGIPATRYDVRNDGIVVQSRVSDTPWNDAGWIQHMKGTNPDLPTVSNPKFAPMLEFRDGGGNRRVIVDHNGFPMNKISAINELWWDTDSSAAPPGWLKTLSTAFASNGTAGFTSGTAAAFTGNTVGSYASVHTRNSTFIPAADGDAIVVGEWDFSPGSVTTIIPDAFGLMGFLCGFDGLQMTGGFWIGARGGTDTTWKLASVTDVALADPWTAAAGANGTIVDTGVSINALRSSMRIEAYGSTAALGGRRVLAYINGNLVAQVTDTSKIPTSNLGWGMQVVRVQASGTTRSVRIGALKIQHNAGVLSDNAL